MYFSVYFPFEYIYIYTNGCPSSVTSTFPTQRYWYRFNKGFYTFEFSNPLTVLSINTSLLPSFILLSVIRVGIDLSFLFSLFDWTDPASFDLHYTSRNNRESGKVQLMRFLTIINHLDVFSFGNYTRITHTQRFVLLNTINSILPSLFYITFQHNSMYLDYELWHHFETINMSHKYA